MANDAISDSGSVAREPRRGFWVRAQRFGRNGDRQVLWLSVGVRDRGVLLPKRLIDVGDREALRAFAWAAERAAQRAFWNDPRAAAGAHAETFARLTDQAVAECFVPTPPGVGEAKEALPWRTARDVAEAAPERPDWIVPRFLVRGEITALLGKIKIGKSTLTAHLVSAVLTGRTFLGQRCQQGAVLLLTEQRASSLRELFARTGLKERGDLHLLHLNDTSAICWPDVAAAAVVKAREVGAVLLVVDTISRWARIADENDAGAMAAGVAPLERAAAAGLGVFIVQHERKSGGAVEDAGRGSSALGGAVDILLRLRRGEGNTPRAVRLLDARSRFDETPEDLAIELVDGEYVVRGTEGAVRRHQAREQVDAVLIAAELEGAGPMTLAALKKRLHQIKDDTLRKALADSVRDGHAVREGTGKRGSPYTWAAVSVSFAPAPPGVGVAKQKGGEAEVSFATPISGVQKQKKEKGDNPERVNLAQSEAARSSAKGTSKEV